ncbi:MAG: FixH family protein [Prevotellaceae bacterium]|nr:FixH family protein [Prevotellaceae bacterium]
MKKVFLMISFFAALFFVSCGKDEDKQKPDINPAEGLIKIQEFADDFYTVTAYNESGKWQIGYTKVYFTVQDKDGNFIDNATLSAFPEMNMGTMKHSTPRSEITKVSGKPLFEANYAFLMAGEWDYTVSYYVSRYDGGFNPAVVIFQPLPAAKIDVQKAYRPDGVTERKVISSVKAIDGSDKRYVVALVEPQKPKAGINDITAYIYERIDGNTYTPVENFRLKLDPRMPAMENHSSPNNEDLTWNATEKAYKGKANFSMTGYWVLNLILQNADGTVLYGNPVTEEIEQSSLYFEVEF